MLVHALMDRRASIVPWRPLHAYSGVPGKVSKCVAQLSRLFGNLGSLSCEVVPQRCPKKAWPLERMRSSGSGSRRTNSS